MAFDASSYTRLDAPHSLGLSASGGEFATSTGDVCDVSAFGPGVFRVRIGARTRPDYGLLTGRAKACAASQVGEAWRFTCGDTSLELFGSPLRVRMMRGERVVLSSVTDEMRDGRTRLPAFGKVRHAAQWVAALALTSGESVYGLGEKFGALDKRGQLLHSWLEEPRGVNTGGSARDVPFAWSPGAGDGAWGVLVHTTGAVIHGIGHSDWSHRTYAIVVEDEALDMFLFAGDTPADVLHAFADLAGTVPSLPPWSYGAWLGFGHADAAHAAQSVARLRERRLPCDVALLALDASPATSFVPGASEPANDAEAIAQMRRSGMRIGMRETPYVPAASPLAAELAASGYLLRAPTGEAYVFEAAPDSRSVRVSDAAAAEDGEGSAAQASPLVAVFDFTSPEACNWWREMHEIAFARGADLIETAGGEQLPNEVHAGNRDTGVRLHNAYPLLFNRCVQGATARFRPGDDHAAVTCASAGWTGSHRVPVACGGDAQLDWEGLAASIRGALSWAMSGGIHYALRAPAPSDASHTELCVRWLQAALFGSHTRIEMGAADPEWLCAADVEPVARKWLSFRYRLLPYLAASTAQAAESGLPIMRAMPLAFPHDPLLQRYDTQFMLGDALLVAPIVHPGGRIDIALPPGGWFDLNSRQRLAGPRVIRYRATLDQFPIFGRDGHALPLGSVVQHAGEIDSARPLAQLWLFGRPTAALEGHAQAVIAPDADGALQVRVAPEIALERFGDAADVPIQSLTAQAS